MRFNSPEHLDTWRRTKKFPQIHDAIASVIVSEMTGRRVLDLGCSFGLLGERIRVQAGAEVVIGVDGDCAAMEAGEGAGIQVTFITLQVTARTMPALIELIRSERIDVLVARRVLPELFGSDLELGKRFARDAAAAGVKQIFLEGRVPSIIAVNPLKSVVEEAELVSASFREVLRAGAVSFLAAR